MARELATALDGPRLASFRDAFHGQVVLRDDDEYDSARRVWNGMIDRRPALVVRPTNVADVQAAIRYGREEELPIDAMVEQAAVVPAAASLSMGALGGAIADVPEDATAYAGRNAAFEIAVDGSWDDPQFDDEVMGWARHAMTRIEPFRTTGVYANSLGDSGEDVARAIYGDTKYELLRALKRRWDPENVFRLNQNIQP